MASTQLKSLQTQAVRYIAVGLGVVGIDYLTFVVFLHFFPSSYIAANALGKIGGAISGFVFHKHYTFAGQQEKSTSRQFFLYIALSIGNMFLSSILIYVGVERLRLNELIAKIITDGIVIACSFIINRLLVFKHTPSVSHNEKQES